MTNTFWQMATKPKGRVKKKKKILNKFYAHTFRCSTQCDYMRSFLNTDIMKPSKKKTPQRSLPLTHSNEYIQHIPMIHPHSTLAYSRKSLYLPKETKLLLDNVISKEQLTLTWTTR